MKQGSDIFDDVFLVCAYEYQIQFFLGVWQGHTKARGVSRGPWCALLVKGDFFVFGFA